jgi:hypothetical protein
MRRTISILAFGAAAVWLGCAMAFAQQVRVQGDDHDPNVVQAKLREQAARARQRSVLGLSNQLRPFYRYELMHVRTACGLSKEQLQKIRPEADAAYDEAIARLEATRTESPRSTGDDEPDYHEVIRKAVHSVVRRHVSREQWDALQADLRLRAASRKEAGTDMLVAVLDRDLFLTGQQRREIAESVSAHWDDRFFDPLEVAFNDQSRCPKIPDELVAPFLSEAQREAWRRIPRLQGRLWGVTIDHGGGPDMERELGAVGVTRRTAPRPAPGIVLPPDRRVIRPMPVDAALAARVARAEQLQMQAAQMQAARRLEMQAAQVQMQAAQMQAAQMQAIQQRAARQPALAARPAPAGDGDDEPEGEQDAAQARMQMQLDRMKTLQAAYLSMFERRVFGDPRGEAAARAEAETALAHRVDYLRLAGRLTDDQWRKLRAAGHGDIKRFFDRFAEAREKMAATVDQRTLALLIQREARSLAEEWAVLQKVEGPIFTKTVDRTITDAHRAAIENEDRDRRAFRLRADVRWTTVLLARSLGLKDDQRRRLESLLLERTVPPEKFESSDYVIVMYEASRIPEREIRPIFDDVQWRVMKQEFAAVQRWELHLKRGGFLRPEMFDDHQDGILPPIQLLAPPPTIRSRR